MAHRSADRSVSVPPGPTLVRADQAPHEPAEPDFPVDLPVRARTTSPLRAARPAKRPHSPHQPHPSRPGDAPPLADAAPEADDELPLGVAAPAGLLISRQDVLVLALAARARFTDPRAEQERDALLTELHAAAIDLARRLRDHTLHCIVEYRGSHGAWDVVAESQGTYAAHERYASVARRAAAQLRPRIAVPAELE